DSNEDAGPDERDHDAAHEGILGVDERPKQQAAEEGPNQPDDDVADDPIAAALHDFPGQKARDEAHDQPGDEATWFQVNVCENRHELAPLSGETRRRGARPRTS